MSNWKLKTSAIKKAFTFVPSFFLFPRKTHCICLEAQSSSVFLLKAIYPISLSWSFYAYTEMTKTVWTRSVIEELDSSEYGVTAPEYNPWLWLICCHYHFSPNLARFLQASSLVGEPPVPKTKSWICTPTTILVITNNSNPCLRPLISGTTNITPLLLTDPGRILK